MKTNKWKGKWGFLLEYPKLGESQAGNAQFPVYWYVIQEGCSNGLAQQPMQERENDLSTFLTIDINENERITVYPNPFETNFTIRSLEDDQLIVQTLDGKFISLFSIMEGENRISMPYLPKGIYICKLTNQLYTFKLLKL